ncbi:MAG: hypothetical protein QG657_926 [Acidobacteriota bacterium]|nr:hypothetical protein [Acidobacteriota bacterium]
MSAHKIVQMREAHQVLCEFPFEIKELQKGYSDRILRIDLDKNEVAIQPVTQQMKDLWTGGKGFDLWLMFLEIDKNTKWDSPNNPICFSPGPLGGTTSFPGSGKTLVTALSPITQSAIDCNVGGFFGPYLKFSGFDALVIVGKAKKETIILIDAVKKKITIEAAPAESIDSHLAAEEFTEMYADDDLDKRNIAVVSAGKAAIHSRMGVLNFSFWDWRRNVTRLKQAGRGGVGTVFRDKMLKALVIKNRDITPAWRVEENKAAQWVKPKKIISQPKNEIEIIDAVIEKWGNNPEYVIEMMQDIQERFHYISLTAIERLTTKTGAHKAYLYHLATFDKSFSLEEKITAPATHAVASIPAQVINAPAIQKFIALRNHDAADAWKIDNYISRGGYEALKKLLNEKKQNDIIGEVSASGLRGRGCGSPIGQKWDTALKAKKDDIYIVCSANEPNADAFINKYILEIDPHSIIEGMLIAAYAVGAKEGFISIKKEFTLAEERLCGAIESARQKGLLGENILGSGFNFTLYIRRGAGAAIFGETTSLLETLAGRVGESHAKYIPVEEVGFRGKPTIISNVETWANIPVIFQKGAQWAAANRTKVFILSGPVRNPGLLEVPLGTTLRDIIEKIGGGASNNGKIKTVQVGGPAGGFIPADKFDLPLDFESLDEAGAMMGSGNILVMDDKTCIPEVVRSRVEFLAEESCGRCTPCREGLFALKNALNRICGGDGKENDIQFLEDVAKTIAETSLCNFGAVAANPVLSSLRYFKGEYEDHIKNKKCGTGAGKSNE